MIWLLGVVILLIQQMERLCKTIHIWHNLGKILSYGVKTIEITENSIERKPKLETFWLLNSDLKALPPSHLIVLHSRITLDSKLGASNVAILPPSGLARDMTSTCTWFINIGLHVLTWAFWQDKLSYIVIPQLIGWPVFNVLIRLFRA